MQALRLASFTHKPSLSAVQTLLMVGTYLTNSGRMLDAYTLLGTTIRLAHSIGLHRHPKYFNPTPTNKKDCAVRQKVWWYMLHLDGHMSMTLGRPLGISGIGDNPWPTELTTDPAVLRFGEFVNHFTALARQIMSSDRLTCAKIDELTDALQRLLDTVPEMLQFDEAWVRPETDLPDLYAIATGTSNTLISSLWFSYSKRRLAHSVPHYDLGALDACTLPYLFDDEDIVSHMNSLTCCSVLL